MRFRFAAAGVAAFSFWGTLAHGAVEGTNSLALARTGIEQWVQTRQLISRTRSDWDSEKELLQQSKALYERELAGLADQLSKVSTNSTQVDRERVAAEAELKEAEGTLDHAKGVVAGLEARIKTATATLPGPLVETMRPLLGRVPEDAKATKLGVTERVQTVVSLLNEIDKFNNAVTVISETRKNEKGEDVSVESVYVGLGVAYFVNQTGDFAGTGVPGTKGWEWTIQPALAPKVRQVVKIYRGEQTASFVSLPVTLR